MRKSHAPKAPRGRQVRNGSDIPPELGDDDRVHPQRLRVVAHVALVLAGRTGDESRGEAILGKTGAEKTYVDGRTADVQAGYDTGDLRRLAHGARPVPAGDGA